jgi:electron transfer flavoprotein alpha subunit
MSILVVCQLENGNLSKNSLKAIAAAQFFQQSMTCLIVTNSSTESVPAYQWLEKAYPIDCKDAPQTCVQSIVELQKKNNYTTIVASDNNFIKQVLPQVAALYDVNMLTGVTNIIDSSTFKRPVFAGDFIATVKSTDPIKVFSIRASAFEQPEINDPQKSIQLEILELEQRHTIKFNTTNQAEPKRDLTTADIVIAGGRGLGEAKHFQLIQQLADKCDAAVGATRAAVDAGWVDNALQVGQTGKVIAPKLYIAIGVSGAIQHLAGIKDSGTIIAINTDTDAPLMQFADYAYQGDLFEAVPQLIQLIAT